MNELPEFTTDPASAAAATRTAIAAVLADLPPGLAVGAIAARVRAAVPFGVELVGTSPAAIAAGVATSPGPERIGAFTHADIARLTAGWRDFPWRLLLETPRSAAANVALDEVLTDQVATGDRPPTLRFWGWAEPAVVLGRCQSVTNEVDPAVGLAVVRRMTGGGAMFVQPHGAITYSLYLPEAAVAGLTIRQSYEVCEAWVVRGLRALGIDAHHVPVNDIACGDGKIGGAAQARRASRASRPNVRQAGTFGLGRGVVLHHTTIAYDMDPAEMARVLRVGRAKVRDRGVASAAKRVSPLTRQTAASREAVVAALIGEFRAAFGGEFDTVTPAEEAAAAALVGSKYGTAAWTREFE